MIQGKRKRGDHGTMASSPPLPFSFSFKQLPESRCNNPAFLPAQSTLLAATPLLLPEHFRLAPRRCTPKPEPCCSLRSTAVIAAEPRRSYLTVRFAILSASRLDLSLSTSPSVVCPVPSTTFQSPIFRTRRIHAFGPASIPAA